MQYTTGCEAFRFDYRSKVEFNATQDLLRSRSDCFLESKRARDRIRSEEEWKNRTPWDIKPPDFTLQIYQPKPPKRNTRESMIPGYNDDEWNEKAKERRQQRIEFERIPLPKILQPPVSEKAPFCTQFRIPDSHAAKITCVRKGIHKRDPYVTPGPHAFRGDNFRPVSSINIYTLFPFTACHQSVIKCCDFGTLSFTGTCISTRLLLLDIDLGKTLK